MLPRILTWVIIGLGLVFWALSSGTGGALPTPFWWVEIILLVVLIAGFALGRGLEWRPRRAVLVAAALIWVCGMGYELTLTVDGTGLGGIHPDTRASFILGQGDYLMIAAFTAGAVWFWRLTPRDVLWLAGGKSLTEGLIFTGLLTGVLTDPALVPFAPLMGSYYVLAYATFMVVPFFIIAPGAVWRPGTGWRPNVLILWATGFAAAFVIRVIWGLGWAPLATWAFGLPPNPVP
jgi:hypothetical protein